MLVDFVKVAQHIGTSRRRLIEQRLPRDLLIVDDVAQMPFARHPGIQIIPASLARIVAERIVGDLIGRDGHRRGQLGARRFGEDSRAAMIGLILPRRATRSRTWRSWRCRFCRRPPNPPPCRFRSCCKCWPESDRCSDPPDPSTAERKCARCSSPSGARRRRSADAT